MDRTIDHVPFAWTDLDEVTAEFDRLGLSPDYGGVHDNGVTHMALLGFDDRSYVELIAERTIGDHDFWPERIRADAGPAAWCVRVPDVVAECKRALDAGVTVHGPFHGSREREDGRLVEWDRAEFDLPGRPGLLPFAIQDRTPLSYRVAPSDSVAGGPLSGIGEVVVAVEDLSGAVEAVRDVYRYPSPVRTPVDGFGTVASFPGRPLALAAPTDDGWLADRLDRLGPGPCSCLLATDDLSAAADAHPLRDPVAWPGGRVATFDSDRLGDRLGVIERD